MSEQQLKVSGIVPKPLLPRPEEQIIAGWEGDVGKPVVSIQCITYNHALYIEEAINSLLMQETSFPFEVWVHDDASTDGTQDILKAYQGKYPKIIKLFLQETNQYSKGIRPTFFLKDVCKGDYCAFCEGDDYWIDPFKLQKQVSYLESHPECVITGHDALIIDDKRLLISSSKLPSCHQRDYSKKDLVEGKAWILTVSWMYRNVVMEFAPERHKVHNGDAFFTAILGQYGSSHYHDDIQPAAYRVHDKGVWSSLSNEDRLDAHMNTFFWMYRYFKRVGEDDASNVFLSKFKGNAFKKSSGMELIKELIVRLTMIRVLKKVALSLLGASGVERVKRLLGK